MRRVVAGVAYAALCVGGFLVFAVFFAAVFGLVHAVTGGIVHGLWLDPKGVVGGLLGYGVPTVLSMMAAERFVLRRLGKFFDRLETWKAQEE